jgi:hypothetical protein
VPGLPRIVSVETFHVPDLTSARIVSP